MLATHIRGAPAAAAPVVGLVEAILRPLQRRWSRARSNLIPRRHHGARLERSNGGEESTAPRKWKGVTSILRTLALSIDRKKRVSCPLSLSLIHGSVAYCSGSALSTSSRRWLRRRGDAAPFSSAVHYLSCTRITNIIIIITLVVTKGEEAVGDHPWCWLCE